MSTETEKRGFRLPRRRLPFFLESRWGRRIFLLAMIVAPPVLFYFWPTGPLERMGYGLIPAALWIIALAVVLRFRPRWALRQWRGWLGGAFLVAAAMGILSFFGKQAGAAGGGTGAWWMDIARANSFGGQWGQILGGDSLLFGQRLILLYAGLKVFGLLSLASLALAPRLTVRAYRKVGEELLAFVWLVMFWIARSFVLLLRYIRARTPTWGEMSDALLRPTLRRLASLPAKLSIRNKMPTWRRIAPRREQAPDGVTEEMEEPEDTGFVEQAQLPDQQKPLVAEADEVVAEAHPAPSREGSTWVLPPEELLNKSSSEPVAEEELQEIAERIERTLGEHGLEVSVESIRPGPRVILFSLAPGWVRRYGNSKEDSEPPRERGRVKVDSIMAREKDLALALKTPSIRLLAPVPGERAVGIEVPNPKPKLVSLRTVTESPSFERITRADGLPIGLGEGTGGDPVAIDLKEMPHLLLAGATGSGKSICINSIVSSLIMTQTPEELRLLMVDPKRVELTPFNGIPHLLMPVIVDTDQVVSALEGVLTEMFRRYRLLEKMGVRAIDTYNRKASEPLPHVVIIVDELADLMMAAAYEVEQSLVRLAQLGRATGIHLVLATQRPSVNVVTGLMKANISGRLAFAVASQVDSRVILDMAGAEKLLGKGDMLFLSPSEPKPQRIQGSYVSEKESERLVLYWKSQRGPLPSFSLKRADSAPGSGNGAEELPGADDYEEDSLLRKAREVAARYKRLSPSVLQRRLRIGYPKALQLIELLEEEGTVAPGDPGTSRPVLLHSKGSEELP